MNELVNFFLEPYKTASTLNIILEIIAATFGIASVLFAKKENVLVFPTGIISTGIYIYLLSQWSLYGDLIINIYYTIMSVFGWYMWQKIIHKDNDEHTAITRTTNKEKISAFGIFIAAAVFVIFIYRYYNIMPNNLNFTESIHYAYSNLTSGSLEKFRMAVPFLDTFTTAAAFVAMWLMAVKKIENWTFWIVTNIVSIPLYFVKGYGFTGIQYSVFLILAILGYQQWKKILDKKKLIL
ncbi:MAG: nicotinamide riboside transporter PnuC [Flavobacteriaceae bacterium]